MNYSLSAGKMDIAGNAFVNVGGDGLDVQNIILNNGSDGNDWMMVFDAATRTYTTLYWYEEVYEDDSYEKSLARPGWGVDYVNIPLMLDPGQGFWVQALLDASITVPGQVVEAEDNTLSTKAGVMDICANIYPMALDVQDIELTGGSDGNDWLMVFDPSTRTYTTLYWYEEVYEDDSYEKSLARPGWGVDYVNIPLTLNPGQGFWIQTLADATITLPAPGL